jgi:uncharacterized membrane protein YbaN (DUF454 family)
MKENFFNSMFSENGKISHKRWISVTIAAVLAWGIMFTIIESPALRAIMVKSTMVFILIMSGVATVPQIISLVRNVKGTEKKDDV